ncbi:MAG: shikimate dehydrogenase [Campylobacteraceae bacterium]|nr:shikimate dehydrogenase [Campylobacteraceae bacterium]
MKLFSIFGNPVAHSISPLLHNSAIKNLNLNACYIKTFLQDGDEIINKFKLLKLSGANVTVPHKENASKLCDDISELAHEIGAVNTLVSQDNSVIGYNTDAPGFYRSIQSFEGIKTALILGAGGTAKAISFILNKNGIKTTVLNRSEIRLSLFDKNNFETFTWENFIVKDFDIIINTTPAGLKDDNLPLRKQTLFELMHRARYAFDVVYGKITPFLQLANRCDIPHKDGKDMLLHQASIAFNLFYNNKYDLNEIEAYMKLSMNLA